MKVHLIRKEFQVTPIVKRYVNVYLIENQNCYLIDCGVSGTETQIEDYLYSIHRTMSDIKGIFLTHSHPDHIGAAAKLKERTGAKVYAPKGEIAWIEQIEKQFEERPIPNFYHLVPESVKVDVPLSDGDRIELEEGLSLTAISTAGHSNASTSYQVDDVLFTGDAIPVTTDIPIFVDFNESINSLARIETVEGIHTYCPAWDEMYDRHSIHSVIEKGRTILFHLQEKAREVLKETGYADAAEILKRSDLERYAGNPLIIRSIQACVEAK